MHRFFLPTILGGRLHVDGVSVWEPWTPHVCIGGWRIHLDLILTTTGDREVRTTEELETAIRESMRVAPTRNVWIRESLEDEARRLWEC